MSLVSDHPDTTNPTASNSDDQITADRVWDMMGGIDIAMFVTKSNIGLRGRPMSTIPTPEKGVIYILTEGNSPAAQDVRADGSVFLSYQGRGDHVAVQGQATVRDDKALVKGLWSGGAQMFWPDGPEAHDVVALVIDPGHADVWDGHGLLRGIASIVKSAVKGEEPDLGTRGAVDL
jgi:general stress protein 26